MYLLTASTPRLLNAAALILRISLGLILFMVGASKVLGWFGGFGINQTLIFYQNMGIPIFLAYLSMFVEFIGGVLVIVGLFTRFALIAIIINMAVATIFSLPGGFLTSAAFPLSLLLTALALLLMGPMMWSLDYLFTSKKKIFTV